MRFKIELAGNYSPLGNLFFSVPTKDEMKKAEKTIGDICHNRATKLYKNNSDTFENSALTRIENELQKMCDTETAYHFLILKEIAELSQKVGYPLMTEGNLSGSVISYLLGITEYDPLALSFEYNSIKLLWGTDKSPRTPDFSICIAPQIRPLINNKLHSKYGYIDCNKDVYKRISLTDANICETLGKLLKATGRKPSFSDYNEKTYIKVVKNIADEYLAEFKMLKKEGYALDEELQCRLSFFDELKQVTSCNFKQLLRLYAYRHASFKHTKSITRLSDPEFFVTRNEFFYALTCCNIPDAVALDIAKKGVGSQASRREQYIKTLRTYNAPEFICKYFSEVTNLWDSDACISRLILMCAVAWYQITFSKEYDKIKNGEL